MNSSFLFFILVYIGLFFDNLNVFKYCLLSSCLHELGHILSYRILIKKWPQIDISVFGFRMKNNVTSNKYMIIILISGPLTNVLISAIAAVLCNYCLTINQYILIIINIIIFTINMIPIYYLDGGQILYRISPFYQRNYKKISIFTLIVIYVMLIYFTDINLMFLLPLVYFIYNILNDV